jgi:hypothetical protein
MSDETGKSLLLTTFVLAIAMLTWSEIAKNHTVPRPQRYVSAGILWSILGLLSPVLTYSLTGLFGMGLFLTLLYSYFKPLPTAVLQFPVFQQFSLTREV